MFARSSCGYPIGLDYDGDEFLAPFRPISNVTPLKIQPISDLQLKNKLTNTDVIWSGFYDTYKVLNLFFPKVLSRIVMNYYKFSFEIRLIEELEEHHERESVSTPKIQIDLVKSYKRYLSSIYDFPSIISRKKEEGKLKSKSQKYKFNRQLKKKKRKLTHGNFLYKKINTFLNSLLIADKIYKLTNMFVMDGETHLEYYIGVIGKYLVSISVDASLRYGDFECHVEWISKSKLKSECCDNFLDQDEEIPEKLNNIAQKINEKYGNDYIALEEK